jgi:uncharacterized protein
MPQPRSIVIPPQSGQALRVKRGDMTRIIDPKGQQVADLWAFAVDGEKLDWLSTSQTRNVTERLFPLVGECFYSAKSEPVLTFIEDASPGPHDMLYPACDRPLYDHFRRSRPRISQSISCLIRPAPGGHRLLGRFPPHQWRRVH